MTRLATIICALLAAGTALAQHEGHGNQQHQPRPQSADPHTGHEPASQEHEHVPRDAHAPHRHPPEGEIDEPPQAPPPAAAFEGPEHAADAIFDAQRMAEARSTLRIQDGGGSRTYLLLADRLEAQLGEGDGHYSWDLQGWYGGDINKLWFKSEGEGEFGGRTDNAELQALYSRAIAPFFDLQAGVRHDLRPVPERTYFVVGLQGLLPYVFEVDAALFLSNKGDLTGRVEGEYDLWITQRLVLQPRAEIEFAAQTVEELRLGSGVTSVEAGLRLRFEIRREFAPYLGFEWERKVGDTADFARADGEDRRRLAVVLGLRAWF